MHLGEGNILRQGGRLAQVPRAPKDAAASG